MVEVKCTTLQTRQRGGLELVNRSAKPFFNKGKTYQVIADIAASSRLLVYVGSGVTIDESGMQWTMLISTLARPVGLSDDMITRLSRSMSAVQLASVVAERYKERYPTNWELQVINQLRMGLYPESRWRRGRFTSSLVLMIAAAARSGSDVLVVTTNYDEHLERAVKFVQGILQDPTIPEFAVGIVGEQATTDEDLEALPSDAGTVSLIHIHGFVPETSSGDDFVVFSEEDYAASEEAVREVLLDEFATRDVLVVGSGLDDPPLGRALLLTVPDAEATGLRRWAILPREAMSASSEPYRGVSGSDDDLLAMAQLRANQMKLTLITPDFFSQASQLPREVGLLRSRSSQEASLKQLRRSYEKDNYKTRLDDWWRSWHAMVTSRGSYTEQTRAHRRLFNATRKIKADILGDPDERVKLELWLRWNPDDRKLALWASSTGTWRDEALMPRVNIEARSDSRAVRVFTSGSTKLWTDESDGYWNRFLGVPVVAGKFQEEQMVGVILLASDKAEGSLLSEARTEVLTSLVDRLEAEAFKVLSASS